MGVNINDIRQRRNAAIKNMSVVQVRKLLLDDIETLIKEVERLRGNGSDNPSESEWQIEEYSVYRTLRGGGVKEYQYKREYRYENGKKRVRHISVRNSTK